MAAVIAFIAGLVIGGFLTLFMVAVGELNKQNDDK